MKFRFAKSILTTMLIYQNLGLAFAEDWRPIFDRAFFRGMVDISGDYWSRENFPLLLEGLKKLNPGIINRFGFIYGGPSLDWLNETAKIAAKIHSAVPGALMGAALPEVLHKNYMIKLNCEGVDTTFVGENLVSNFRQGQDDLFWIDINRPLVKVYYKCLGAKFISEGFQFIHFEAPSLVLSYSTDKAAGILAYAEIGYYLRAAAATLSTPTFLSGDLELSREMSLDAIYIPSRFYHNSQFALKYRNKIERPGVGIGYSYVLSERIIRDALASVGRKAKIFFYIDNWDKAQDDLRRLMELDQFNRLYLFSESWSIARHYGVGFVIPLEHCVGCINPQILRDNCEARSDGRTEYSAVACNDIDKIVKIFDTK